MRLRVAISCCVARVGTGVLASGCGSSGSSSPGVGTPPCRWHSEKVSPATSDDLTGVSFPDLTHGWAVGGIDRPTIRATSDGGQSWHAQRANRLYAIAFRDATHGWAVGQAGTIIACTA